MVNNKSAYSSPVGHFDGEGGDQSRAARGSATSPPTEPRGAKIPPVLPDGTIIGGAREAIDGH
ncbi:hypothetical protein [Amnibacterium sp.]|uniref:hypothetical protein n=1 Tax=Amnibacterium sp. TaxID=1872496 RepID=UPI002602B1A8|nr:hypothetical protein [Amnibacterium sp.]MCU1474533.1 hypothetical protein [Amnibacterium sp.]